MMLMMTPIVMHHVLEVVSVHLFFIMKVSARDRRINGVVADLRGEEWINDCDIRINVTANYLLRNCNAIVNALPDVLPPFGHAIVVINHGAVISYLGDVNEDNVFAGVHI